MASKGDSFKAAQTARGACSPPSATTAVLTSDQDHRLGCGALARCRSLLQTAEEAQFLCMQQERGHRVLRVTAEVCFADP